MPGVHQASVTELDGLTELKLILETDDALSGVLEHLHHRGSSLLALEKRDPTLEDVFIDLVERAGRGYLAQSRKTKMVNDQWVMVDARICARSRSGH